MKSKHIWLFTISLLWSLFAFSQEEEGGEAKEKKSPRTYALRVGLDMIKPARTQFEDGYQGLELVGDLKLNKRVFIAAEVGSEKRTQQSEQINFTTKGSYIKAGIDYNFFNNWKGMNNSLFIGFRLARSLHTHTVNNYTLYSLTQYLTVNTAKGYLTGEREQLSTAWFEFLFGIKVQLLPNFYAGLSLRMHGLLNDKQPQDFGNLYAPGFNRITDDNKFGGSINYTLTYSLPFRFKKKLD
jgi:hypothetical protein